MSESLQGHLVVVIIIVIVYSDKEDALVCSKWRRLIRHNEEDSDDSRG